MSSPPRGRSSVSIGASLPALTNERVRRPSSIGGTIWRLHSAQTAKRTPQRQPRSPNSHRPSGLCSSVCSRRRAATARWSRFWLSLFQHDEQAVLAAVELALEAGAPTKTHILNLLHRLIDGKPIIDPPAVKPPINVFDGGSPPSRRPTSNATMRCAKPARRAMRHNPCRRRRRHHASAVSKNARTWLEGRRRADRARLSGLRGGAADPIAAPKGGDVADRESEIDGLSAQSAFARFPNYRDLAGFELTPAVRSTRRSRVNSIAASSWKTPTMSFWSAARGNRQDASSPPRSASPGDLSIIASASGSFSTVELVNALEQEKLQGKPGPDRSAASPTPISSSSMSWATCRSVHRAGPCSSTY